MCELKTPSLNTTNHSVPVWLGWLQQSTHTINPRLFLFLVIQKIFLCTVMLPSAVINIH